MQFLVLATDGTDAEAGARRRAALDEHNAMVRRLVSNGHLMFGVALNNDAGDPVGSMMVFEYDSREELAQQLEEEPYMLAKVWNDVKVQPCTIGKSFEWTMLEAGSFKLDSSDAPSQ